MLRKLLPVCVAALVAVFATSCKSYKKCSEVPVAECNATKVEGNKECLVDTTAAEAKDHKCADKTDAVADANTEALCKKETDQTKCEAIETKNARFEDKCKFDGTKTDDKCYAEKK